MSLFDVSGALGYHSTALFRKNSWKDFKQNLSNDLLKYNWNSSNLTLIGPSGGYCLSHDFLMNFKQINCIDTDPLARFFFQLNHRSIKCHWNNRDFFSNPSGLTTQKLESLFSITKENPILFCNLIGQIILKYSSREEETQKFFSSLIEYSFKYPVYSFHDRISFEGSLHPNRLTFKSKKQLKSEELIDLFFSKTKDIEFRDHDTFWELEQVCYYYIWPLHSKVTHIIELVNL